MDLESKDGTLSQSIKEQLTKKAKDLGEDENFSKQIIGMSLENSLEYTDEWVRHVEDFYRELKLVYREQSETDEMISDEESTRENQSFGTSSFEKSTKDNITSNIKLRLSLLVSPKLDPIFNAPTFVPFDEVYTVLQKALVDNIALQGEDLFDIFYSKIADLTTKKPYLEGLIRQFKTINEYQKAELVQAFNLDKNNFIGTLFNMEPIEEGRDIVGYKTTFEVQNLSNSGGKSKLVKNNWFYNFNKNFSNENGIYTQDARLKYGQTKKEFNKYFLGVKGNIKNNNYNTENFGTEDDPIYALVYRSFNYNSEGDNSSFNSRVVGSSNKYFEIIEIDEANNYRIYTIHVTNMDTSVT
jgi:hypothetical protein